MTSRVAYWHVSDIEAKLAEATAAGATLKDPARDVGGGRLGGHRHRPRRERPRDASGHVATNIRHEEVLRDG
jgi:hypothetical protein